MDRADYIGSTDARTILTGNWDVLYAEKKGLRPRPDFTDNFPVQLGILTEPFHCNWVVKRLNEGAEEPTWEYSFNYNIMDEDKHRPPETDQHFASVTLPGGAVLGSHPDGLLRHRGSGAVYVLEAKHTGRFSSPNDLADFYMPQIQHHLLCWGHETLMLSAIIGNLEPERIWIGASKEWQDHYAGKCQAFWDFYTAGKMPPPSLYESNRPIVPTKIADSVPFNGFKRRDISSDNYLQSLVPEYVAAVKAGKRLVEIKSEMKKAFADDENELYSASLTLKKDKRGAMRIKVTGAEEE